MHAQYDVFEALTMFKHPVTCTATTTTATLFPSGLMKAFQNLSITHMSSLNELFTATHKNSAIIQVSAARGPFPVNFFTPKVISMCHESVNKLSDTYVRDLE